MHAFKCHYRRQLKIAATIDGGLLQDVMHFISEAWRLITPTTIKNCFVKCGFSMMTMQ
jgi:hypothetical protein